MSLEIVTVCAACKPTLDRFLKRAEDAERATEGAAWEAKQQKENVEQAYEWIRRESTREVVKRQSDAIRVMANLLTHAAGLEPFDRDSLIGETARKALLDVSAEAEALVARLKEAGL